MEKTIKFILLHQGRNFSFRTDEVELPNGRRVTRDVVVHPGAVAVIPVLSDGRLVLVRQYRYAVHENLLEIPAGTLEEGEKPQECAFRELIEETGYNARSLTKLLSCYVAPGYSSEMMHFYLATELMETNVKQNFDEEIVVEKLECRDVMKLIDEGTIKDAKTLIGLLVYFMQS